MTIPLLLIAGIPAAGKTYFSQWLASEKGYRYLDLDSDSSMRLAKLEVEWLFCLRTKDASLFVSALRPHSQPVVLEWGFPLHHISSVQALKQADFSLWWFDADHVRAKEAFIDRGIGSLQDFEIQMKTIITNWTKIESLFTPNIVTTLDAQGKRLSVKDIYRRITETTG